MGFKSLSFFLCILNTILCAKNYADQVVPKSFAFQTVTHTRAGDYSYIEKHINWYASMDCSIASEVNIVWNNEIDPEKAPIKLQKDQWKRPVYFYKTPNNSMDWRYKLSPQSKAQVYFIVDDDVTMDCEQLSRGFKTWQNNAVGSVGPIVTYAVRFFDYTHQNGFHYGMSSPKYYTIGLVGVSFMSRHFMDLYYAQMHLLLEMRKIVREKNNCDDIGLNWLIQYFYPELETIYIQAVKGSPIAISPRVAQSTSKNHYVNRSECLQAFTDLFGINSLRYKPVIDPIFIKQFRKKPMMERIVNIKWRYLDAIIKGKTTGEAEAIDQSGSFDEKQVAFQQLQYKLLDAINANQLLQEKSKKLQQQLKALENSNQTTKIAELPQLIEQTVEKKVIHKIPLTQILSISVVILIMIIAFLMYKLIALTHQNKFLHLRDNQVNAVQTGSCDLTE